MESVSFKCLPTEDGKLNPESPRAMLLAVKARKGIPIVVTLEDFKTTRSNRQNRYLWGVCVKLFCEARGFRFNDKRQKDFMYHEILLACGHYEVRKGLDGKDKLDPLPTHNMKTDAFYELCETIQQLGAENDIYIPDPIREAGKKKPSKTKETYVR